MKLIRLNQIFAFIQTILFLTALSFGREYVPSTNLNRDGECPPGYFLDCSNNSIEDRILEDGYHLDDICDSANSGTNIDFGCEEFV